MDLLLCFCLKAGASDWKNIRIDTVWGDFFSPYSVKRYPMKQMIKFLKKVFGKSEDPDLNQAETLRHDFKERYHTFKLLLAANNAALENFAQIEKLLAEGQIFGMADINTNITAASVNVFKMIRKLDRLSSGKYKALSNRFDTIQNDISLILNETRVIHDKRLVIDISEIDRTMSDDVGQKIANLGEIKNKLHLKVPDGFVITAHACEMFIRYNALQIEINRRIKTIINDDLEQIYLCSQTIQQLIINSKIPPDLELAIKDKIKSLNPDIKNTTTFALRSSALGEDSHDASFAGQYKSLLNVSEEHLFQAYKEVIASKYSLQAINYRLARGFKDEDILMSVGCLTMIDALSGGVIYSHNPFQIYDDSIFIQSTWGLPKAIVDGSVNSDLFVVSRNPKMRIRHKDIKRKEAKFTCYPEEGVARKNIVDEFQSLPSIGEKEILHLARLSKKIESHYGVPQDIEWALSNNDSPMIYLLQTRPLKVKSQEKRSHDLPQIDLGHRITKQGVMASPGSAFGQAYIADKEVDLLRFPKDAVLVVHQARPEWAPLLSKAAAVISESGGFAGHLASVAREMGIPALFGVSEICQKIETGVMLTVDAEGLSVYKGKIKTLLAEPFIDKKLIIDTPVFNTLKRISRHIIPLNLLDPDSADFRPKNCQTLHDITRFIHEKSVTEMFNFGKSHGFDQVSSKQLHHGIPMKWWVLNLDDGFKKEVKGKYIYLDDIASVPMMALWEGIIAVPWDGPPAVDKKGLMSVMFQATVNPALITGVRTKYAERNYFMISRKYCSLSSRLGFHFSTLESFVGERVSENYISFRFQGGAADHTRRLKRVQFIGDFLSGFGFKIKIRNDNLNAHLKGYDKEYILNRLKIIGYLTIHTRQLDMITSNPVMIAKYINKFKNDIESVLNIKRADTDLSKHKGH